MAKQTALGSKKIMAFVATEDAATAKAFYRDTLGLRLIGEDPFALSFDAHGIMLRVTRVRKAVIAPYTVLGWQVRNVNKTVKALLKMGVIFERYKGMGQDDFGIWQSPTGAKVAWFKDPDGNTLSLTQL
jgi:catechol 2,3-dioxygenase-like lactoylglutathione lyase family enzyme